LDPADRFLRRVLHRPDQLEWHDDLRRWVPSLASVRFHPDGMSVFVRRLLEERHHGPADVNTLGDTNHKAAVVYQFDLAAVTDVGFSAHHSPNHDTAIGYAHASIVKPDLARADERRARTTLAAGMALVHGSVVLPPPEGA
jgi:hypothetical protein